MAHHRNRTPLTDNEHDARRQADRDRLEQAARVLPDQRRLAALDPRSRQQRPVQVQASLSRGVHVNVTVRVGAEVDDMSSMTM